MRLIPILYFVIIIVETIYLSVIYIQDPPNSSAPLSIYLGWGGLIAMIVMLVYSIARRSRGLRQVARLSAWLHLHIFLGFQGMILVGFHSTHLFTREAPISPLNPGFLSFVFVLIVFFSGLFGRYMYSMLPRSIHGERMEVKDVDAELSSLGDLPDEVLALSKTGPKPSGLVGLMRADLDARRARRQLSGMSLAPQVRALAERRLILERRMIAYAAANKIFSRWIIAHRPIAAMMYVLAAVHVILSYMFTPGL